MNREKILIKKLAELSTNMLQNIEFSEEERISYACAMNDAMVVVINSAECDLQVPEFMRCK